jgi:SOS response regulatory protein OraA/RecX
VPARARDEALETLERVGLVDDARVAATRAQALAGRGLGDAAIRHDLEHEGVSGALVEETLAALEPEGDRARELVAKRGVKGGAAPKTARWLASRGFDASSIEDALRGFEAFGEFAEEA